MVFWYFWVHSSRDIAISEYATIWDPPQPESATHSAMLSQKNTAWQHTGTKGSGIPWWHSLPEHWLGEDADNNMDAGSIVLNPQIFALENSAQEEFNIPCELPWNWLPFWSKAQQLSVLTKGLKRCFGNRELLGSKSGPSVPMMCLLPRSSPVPYLQFLWPCTTCFPGDKHKGTHAEAQ